ncbi:hypothetical protein HA402_010946 [Bradysia odoriphaga]|nr:hypothetical protein HA402_010946 [Bradysia odoriphaga]
MTGTILENLSTKKLTILVVSLLICQFVCFLIGGLIAPIPASVQSILGTICDDVPGSHNDTSIWLYSRGAGQCSQTVRETIENKHDDYRLANKMVFVFQMPLPREGKSLDYSRWQQNIIGILQPDIAYHENLIVDSHAKLTIDARLAYRNKDDPDNGWKLYASSLERRDLDCKTDKAVDEYLYQCSTIPLFELGSLHHDYYLLNVRLPVDSDLKMNLNIGNVQDMHLITIYQNWWLHQGLGFIEDGLLPVHRGHYDLVLASRTCVATETGSVGVHADSKLFSVPLEYLTLAFDMPFMLLLSDLRQGIFYATLLSFWLVFAGEHMLIQDNGERNSLKIYWKHLSAVVVGCLSLFVFDVCERGVQLRNPFFSIWVSNFGSHFALTFIILGGISAGIYFLFLCYMIWNVFCNISIKRSSLPYHVDR